MPTQKFWVKDLKREDETRVEQEIRRVPGVLFASVHHRDQCAEVEFDDDLLAPDEIRAAIEALGFDVGLAG
jgi:copper chaperone CopZ